MPIERQHVNAIRVLLCHAPEPCECHDCREEDQADNHVEPVQSYQRVIGGSEEVGADRQPDLINQSLPFTGGSVEERGTKRDRRHPEAAETSNVRLAKGLDGEVDGDAAREQTNREEDWNLESLLRHRSREALADVENVGDDEDDED